jgi:serine O-acetyltransferase
MEFASRVGDAASTAPLRTLIKEDFETHWRSWGRPGLHALIVYRLGRWAKDGPSGDPRRLAAKMIHRLFNTMLIRNVYGMEISVDAVIGRRVMIGHHQAVQIPAFCIIGDGTLIRHNVNIGFGRTDENPYDVPHLGRDVKLGSGCCLLGPIRIGHGARIGPNCVVMTNVPDGATLVAPPPRVFAAAPHSPVGRRPAVSSGEAAPSPADRADVPTGAATGSTGSTGSTDGR